MSGIWDELDARPAIDSYLGIAHGWAGYLYAAMRWSAASGDALPARLVDRLNEHAALRTPKGRGAYWRITVEGPGAVARAGRITRIDRTSFSNTPQWRLHTPPPRRKWCRVMVANIRLRPRARAASSGRIQFITGSW